MESCTDCKFFVLKKSGLSLNANGQGECRCFPPTASVAAVAGPLGQTGMQVVTVFPVVNPSMGCGCFQRKMGD